MHRSLLGFEWGWVHMLESAKPQLANRQSIDHAQAMFPRHIPCRGRAPSARMNINCALMPSSSVRKRS